MRDLTPYFVSGEGLDPEDLLGDWRWLLGNVDYQVYRITCLGDLFLQDSTGRISFLDIMEGNLTAFASDDTEFQKRFDDRHIRQRYLLTFAVRYLRDAGIVLQPGECYSPDHPPILGGQL